jgi:O-acetylhomoserine/O-acetylserine sulfhydrylase-like pyridoxal-dependent enzyme
MKLETRCLHGGQVPDPTTGSRAVTIDRLNLDQAFAKA